MAPLESPAVLERSAHMSKRHLGRENTQAAPANTQERQPCEASGSTAGPAPAVHEAPTVLAGSRSRAGVCSEAACLLTVQTLSVLIQLHIICSCFIVTFRPLETLLSFNFGFM